MEIDFYGLARCAALLLVALTVVPFLLSYYTFFVTLAFLDAKTRHEAKHTNRRNNEPT